LVPQLSEADVATMYENLTIYDLRDVPPKAARALVRETLARWPLLQAIYDDAFVDALVRRRTSENSLLLRLIQPNDPLNVTFWNEVVDELIVLGGAHAVATFRDRMRLEKLASIESWLTEIRLPAWLARIGIAIELEPLTVGKRRADFRAASVPMTWWEIKTPLDISKVRSDDALLHDLRERLGKMRQPFNLTLEEFDLERDALPSAVADLQRQLLAYAGTGGTLPHAFTTSGLVVEATGRAPSGQGGLAVLLGREYVFEGEHVVLAAQQIRDAARQLPPEGAGIVVVDCSNTDWLDDTDVQDACYGVPGPIRTPTGVAWGRPGGVFRRTAGTRISAVVSYARNVVRSRYRHDIVMLHNPYAKVPLPPEAFAFPDVRHGRIVASSGGFVYRLADYPS
jgi:hypothetical protein